MSKFNVEDLTVAQLREIAELWDSGLLGDRDAGRGKPVRVSPLEEMEDKVLEHEDWGSVPRLSQSSPFERFLGVEVVVRSHLSGVWWGKVEAVHGEGLTLAKGARQAHSWTQAGACAGLRNTGPGKEGRYTPPSESAVVIPASSQIIDVGAASKMASEAWRTVPQWTGR